jgi:hypothetical protein
VFDLQHCKTKNKLRKKPLFFRAAFGLQQNGAEGIAPACITSSINIYHFRSTFVITDEH